MTITKNQTYRIHGKFCSKFTFIASLNEKLEVLKSHYKKISARLHGNINNQTFDAVVSCLNKLNHEIAQLSLQIWNTQYDRV